MRHHFLSGALALAHTARLLQSGLRPSSSCSSSSVAGRVLRDTTTISSSSSSSHRGVVQLMASGAGPARSSASSSTTVTSPRTSSTDSPNDEAQRRLMQDVLYRVRDVNRMPDEVRSSLLDFRVDGLSLGRVLPETADLLCTPGGSPLYSVFERNERGLTLSDRIEPTYEARTEAVAQVTSALRERGIVKGWRDELYPVTTSFYDPPAFAMERAAVPLLGAIEYGVHINGLVLSDDASAPPRMWMARRSRTKSKFPGMLDHLVAGGQPVGIGLLDNAVKECFEEAGIPEELARRSLRPAGAISYQTYNGPGSRTISRAVLFNFDLHLPPDFVPSPVDGEVEEFFLWTVDDLFRSMAPDYPDPIKPNCYSVIIDYLVRAGHLNPDVPGYLDVVRELRSGDCA